MLQLEVTFPNQQPEPFEGTDVPSLIGQVARWCLDDELDATAPTYSIGGVTQLCLGGMIAESVIEAQEDLQGSQELEQEKWGIWND